MRTLLDINVLLDVFLARQPWLSEASQVWDANQNGRINGVIAAFSLPTLYYIVRRHIDLDHANDAVRICLASFEVGSVQRSTLELALNQVGEDFEDNLQLACALEAKVDAVVTRDPRGFPDASVSVLSPNELLAQLA